jgi:Kef-type K+ transport system membrane component KefB
MRSLVFGLGLLAVLACAPLVLASESGASAGHSGATTFLWIAVVLIAAKLSSLVERFGQPSVFGELVIGVVLGNLALLGVHNFDSLKHDSIIAFLAELGVVILLFQIGLETNVKDMAKVGARAFSVACLGVAVPFILGYLIGPYLLPGLSANAYIFLGVTLTATSVGITARVFHDLGKLQTIEAQIVFGAAVIDDVLGLILLAVVSAIVTVGSAPISTILFITVKAFAFLVGAIMIGQFMAPRLGQIFAKIHTGVGMKFTMAISFGLVLAFLANKIGLAPIVGAFAAGLVLDPVHFRNFKDANVVHDVKDAVAGASPDVKEKVFLAIEQYSHRHIEELVEPVGLFLVPIFFVMTGVNVKLEAMFDPKILLTALGITFVAFVGKIVSGLVAGKVNKWIVGFGMVPRGEVGLIFAVMGKSLGVFNDAVFSVIVIVIILTTMLTPPILTSLLKRSGRSIPTTR